MNLTTSTVELLVWALFAAVVAGTLTAFLNEFFAKALVRALLDKKAETPETALTLAEIGFSRFALWYTENVSFGNARLYKSIVRIPPTDQNGKERDKELLFQKKTFCRYYLPPENTENRSFKRHMTESTPLYKLLLVLALLLVAALLAAGIIRYFGSYTAKLFSSEGTTLSTTEEQSESLLEEQIRSEQERLAEEARLAEEQTAEQAEEAPSAGQEEPTEAERLTETPADTQETETIGENADAR